MGNSPSVAMLAANSCLYILTVLGTCNAAGIGAKMACHVQMAYCMPAGSKHSCNRADHWTTALLWATPAASSCHDAEPLGNVWL